MDSSGHPASSVYELRHYGVYLQIIFNDCLKLRFSCLLFRELFHLFIDFFKTLRYSHDLRLRCNQIPFIGTASNLIYRLCVKVLNVGS
ncbi:hypothetical protein V5799_015888 [Amblyomma americanum]|uniref:Uncharacterized protein n=1 Tax=Amblyomma americanum TaxID=6943 RepID=A0AAQ4F7E6_AMBAM